MRKITIITIILIVLIGTGIYLIVEKPFSSGSSKELEDLTIKFLEDLQFKDFRSSSLYHHKLDQNRVDIGKALERLFMVKPELLDIVDYQVVRTELDSGGSRAKVTIRVRYRVVNVHKEMQEKDLLIYWMLRHPDCPIGGTCSGGICLDEQKKEMMKPKAKKKRNEPEPEPEPYSCSDTVKPAWFMNLDSTLSPKSYK